MFAYMNSFSKVKILILGGTRVSLYYMIKIAFILIGNYFSHNNILTITCNYLSLSIHKTEHIALNK